MSITQKRYQAGYNLYMGGYSLNSCTNADMRRGWWAALSASSDAETAAYLSKAGVR